MKLNYITFMVRDINKSIAFYEDLVGLQIHNRFRAGNGEIAFLSNQEGETKIELIQFEEGAKVSTEGLVMSFLVQDNLDSLWEKANTLGYVTSEIIDRKPKPRHFTVLDPDKITIEFSI